MASAYVDEWAGWDKMKEIQEKLRKINNYWNRYYFKKEFFQKKINFTEDVKKNYYGDLNNYLLDTLDLVDEFKEVDTAQDYISKSIVLMQIIYVHQDLIDELLYIFKFKSSLIDDKNPNRTIRNELVGHPIRRQEVLNSSVLFDIHNRSQKEIRYTKYSKENSFKPDLKIYNIKDIIERHQNFLHKYLDEIIKKILKDEEVYKRILNCLPKIPLYKQFNFIEQNDKNLLSEIDTIFETDNLKYYHKNMDKHPRYKHCINEYIRTLDEVIYDKETAYHHSNMDIYMQEQLNKKDSHFNIDYWIRENQNNQKVLEELNYMKEYFDNDREYYASLSYLGFIF